jgi:hypothetical protein
MATDAASAVTSAADGTQTNPWDEVNKSIANFALAMAQNTRSEMSDELNKLEHKMQQIKQESGER